MNYSTIIYHMCPHILLQPQLFTCHYCSSPMISHFIKLNKSLGNNTLEGKEGHVSILECKQACTGLDWSFGEFLVGLLVPLPNNVVNTLIRCKKCQCKRQILPTHNFCSNNTREHRKKRDYAHACIMWIIMKLNKWTEVIPKSNTDFNYTWTMGWTNGQSLLQSQIQTSTTFEETVFTSK